MTPVLPKGCKGVGVLGVRSGRVCVEAGQRCTLRDWAGRVGGGLWCSLQVCLQQPVDGFAKRGRAAEQPLVLVSRPAACDDRVHLRYWSCGTAIVHAQSQGW